MSMIWSGLSSTVWLHCQSKPAWFFRKTRRDTIQILWVVSNCWFSMYHKAHSSIVIDYERHKWSMRCSTVAHYHLTCNNGDLSICKCGCDFDRCKTKRVLLFKVPNWYNQCPAGGERSLTCQIYISVTLVLISHISTVGLKVSIHVPGPVAFPGNQLQTTWIVLFQLDMNGKCGHTLY